MKHNIVTGKQSHRKVQMKLGVILLSVTTLFLAGFGFYQYYKFREDRLTTLQNVARFAVERLAENLVLPLWNVAQDQIDKVIVAEMRERSISAIVVRNQYAQIVAGKTQDAQGELVELTDELTGDFITSKQEIVSEHGSLGSVEILLTRQFMNTALRRELLDMAASVIALDVVLFIVLVVTTRTMLVQPLNQFLRVGRAIAEGDLRQEITFRQSDEIGALANAFREMQAKIATVVREVKVSTSAVTQRSREMNIVAEQMSEGSSEQASATEEVSASMDEMAATIRQTAENARLTEGMALASAEDARAGKQAVTEIIQAMEVIAERVSMVQEIAGQTNILSLNATIEAAKAQEHGRGFAVVASSVRDLAGQSRAAADEIRTLVHSCVVLSAQAGEVLQRLVPNSEKTAELVQEISAASQEQATGVDHVNRAVQQLDSVTQQNAATAEEVAVTAEGLTTQADTLQQTMAFFTVNEVQSLAPTKETDVLQLLQGIEKERLVALLTPALSGQHQDAEAATADPPSQTLSESPAPDRGREIFLAPSNDGGDEWDQEFERY